MVIGVRELRGTNAQFRCVCLRFDVEKVGACLNDFEGGNQSIAGFAARSSQSIYGFAGHQRGFDAVV